MESHHLTAAGVGAAADAPATSRRRGTRPIRGRVIGVAVAAAAIFGGGTIVDAQAASGPPAPKTYHGATATLYASGMKNVTSMAWGDGAMFAGDSGGEGKVPNGGVYLVKDGKGTLIPSAVKFVGGMAWHDGALYLSGAVLAKGGPSFQIDRWSGFTGSKFSKEQVLYTAPKGFQGFNGIGFGADGRLYVGADAGLLDGNDHGAATISPYVYDMLSMTATGKDLKVFASGMRQPWQMVFAPGSSSPFVSDLGEDDGPGAKQNPPDMILKVKAGDDYGFPTCNYGKGSPCSSNPTPFKTFVPHTSIMGLAILKQTLYFGSFEGLGGKGGGALYATPMAGGKVTPVVTGFPLATDALASHDGKLYVGGSTQKGAGLIYEVTL